MFKTIPNIKIEINLKNLKTNIQKIKKTLPKNTKLLLPVKSDAYGHGIKEISLFVEKNKLVDAFGVANISESEILIKNKTKLPIYIFSESLVIKENIEFIVKNKIIQIVSSFNLINAINKESKKQNKITKIHLMIDTGMGRGGVLEKDLEALLKKIKKMKNVVLDGLCTHFPVSDEKDEESIEYTKNQLEKFNNILLKIKEYFPKNNFILHTSNSGAIVLHPENNNLNMVRPGIAVYGYPEPQNNNLNLKPVMSVSTRISLIKTYPKNHSIGYGRTYKTKKENERIALIPIGYGDNFSRLFSNNFEVIIRGKKYKSVGRVSMDQSAILIDDNVKLSDEAMILGKQKQTEITAYELAKKTNTITNEILCNLGQGQRARRKYIE